MESSPLAFLLSQVSTLLFEVWSRFLHFMSSGFIDVECNYRSAQVRQHTFRTAPKWQEFPPSMIIPIFSADLKTKSIPYPSAQTLLWLWCGGIMNLELHSLCLFTTLVAPGTAKNLLNSCTMHTVYSPTPCIQSKIHRAQQTLSKISISETPFL